LIARLDGWMNRLDGWMDRQIRWMHGCIQTDRQTDRGRWKNGWLESWKAGVSLPVPLLCIIVHICTALLVLLIAHELTIHTTPSTVWYLNVVQ